MEELAPSSLRSRLRVAVSILSVVLGIEVVGGLAANSLALLSDAGHLLTDVLALALTWYATQQAEKPAIHQMTFGYHRIGIITALFNSGTLVAVALFILWEAYQRLQRPEAVEGGLMLTVAAVGLAANLFVAWLLHLHRESSLGMASAFLHVVGDALTSVGVLAGAAVIFLTGWSWVDPLASLLISGVLLLGAWRIVREGLAIVLEATPDGLDTSVVVQALYGIGGVHGVHDLHIWTIAPRIYALSCHIWIDDVAVSESARILAASHRLLEERFHIGHSTIQLECEGYDRDSLYCRLQLSGERAHDHLLAADPAGSARPTRA